MARECQIFTKHAVLIIFIQKILQSADSRAISGPKLLFDGSGVASGGFSPAKMALFLDFYGGSRERGSGGRGSGKWPGISRLQNFLDENDQDCVFCEDLALPGLFVCLPCAIWGVPP